MTMHVQNEFFENNNSTQVTDTTYHHGPRVITQVVVSILSFLASLLVSISVAAPCNKNHEDTNNEERRLGLFKNPYRRIIFGLCLADMFLSYGFAIGKN